MVQLLGGVFVSPLIILSVSRNRWVFPTIGGEPPKWMVKIMEMDDLGEKTHYFWKHPGGMSFLEELFPMGLNKLHSAAVFSHTHLVHPLQPRWEGKEPPKLLPQKSSNQTKNSRAVQRLSRWWFQICIIFTQKHGEMIQFDYVIFFRCAETTNKLIWGRVFFTINSL